MKNDRLAHYEAVRVREQVTLDRLLALLRRLDRAPADWIEQVRDARFHTDHPFLIVLVGPFNAGKSSIINALIDTPALEVGPTPTTRRVTVLRHGAEDQESRADGDVYTRFHPAPILEKVSFVDTPGLESVFIQHDAITRRFLHRADLVFLVMLATQALSAGSLDDLVELRSYGKPVIILVNQADLLEPGENEKVTDFVADACKRSLGEVPEIWPVSAKTAIDAESHEAPAWAESGLGRVLDYIEQRLDDEERLRQKLKTSIQIGENATRAALERVQSDLDSLDEHLGNVQNIRAQITRSLETQAEIVDEYKAKVAPAFDEAGVRATDAISNMFRFGAALGLLRRGLTALIFSRRRSAQSYAEQAFDEYKVRQPLEVLGDEINSLAPRLEGEDLKAIDRLVDYGRAQVERLPENLREKVIGRVEGPSSYRRAPLQEMTKALKAITKDAGAIEGDRLERAARNAMLSLAGWQVTLFLVVFILAAFGVLGSENGLATLLLVLTFVLLGFAWMPFQAGRMARRYTNRLDQLRDDFAHQLDETTRQHLDYSRQVREDAVQPYTHLIETQAEELERTREDLAGVQRELAEASQMLGK